MVIKYLENCSTIGTVPDNSGTRLIGTLFIHVYKCATLLAANVAAEIPVLPFQAPVSATCKLFGLFASAPVSWLFVVSGMISRFLAAFTKTLLGFIMVKRAFVISIAISFLD